VRVPLPFLFVFLSLCCSATYADPPTDLSHTAQQLQQLRDDIKYFTSDDLRGRGVDDNVSIAKAAQYIADRMKSVGLDTGLYDRTPFQKVPLTLEALAGAKERNRLTITFDGNREAVVASLPDSFSPLAIGSLTGRVTGRLVFAGYGITAQKYNYDDYGGIDVAGAIVVILRKEPGASDPQSPFNGTRNTRHAFFTTKVKNAIDHGASAVILVNDQASIDRSADRVRSQIELEELSRQRTEEQMDNLPAEAINLLKSLTDKIDASEAMIQALGEELKQTKNGLLGVTDAGQRPDGKDSIPVVSISRRLADRLLRQADHRRLRDIEAQIDQAYSPQSVELVGVKANLQVELKPSVADTSNVVGVIPGVGPLADQSIVVGAHYDHVGMGGYGSLAPGTVAIHNGADDNASGTAALLASAKRIGDRLTGVQSHRRVIFIAFTGEERGLIGSKFYVRFPRFPLESTVAMINMDMVGRLLENELTVYGTGSALVLDEILEQVNQRQQFNLFRVATGYGPSDHQSFFEAGVPVMFFFTGLHSDYHRPSDDFEKINFGGLTRITDTVSEVTIRLATRIDRPQYIKTKGMAKIRRQLTAYLGVQVNDRNGRVVLTGLTAGGPAERGGLRIGDTIVKLSGDSIGRSSDVAEKVREHSPKEKVVLRVIRRGNTIDYSIQLGTRPDG